MQAGIHGPENLAGKGPYFLIRDLVITFDEFMIVDEFKSNFVRQLQSICLPLISQLNTPDNRQKLSTEITALLQKTYAEGYLFTGDMAFGFAGNRTDLTRVSYRRVPKMLSLGSDLSLQHVLELGQKSEPIPPKPVKLKSRYDLLREGA